MRELDHFKDIDDLLKHIDIWYETNDIDYTRWFGLEELKTLKEYIIKLREENKHIFANVNDDMLLRSCAMYSKENERLQQENKQLKKQLANDIDRYEDTISYQLGYDNAKAFYEKILIELEEWLNLEISIHDEDYTIDTLYSCVLNKIQELKEKYK